MDRQQANEQSKKSGRGNRSLRCIWYCGCINEEIRKAVKLGEKSVQIVFPPRHYVVQHRELFREIYLDQGFDVSFEPNFQYIQPTEWKLILSWEDEK